jgi:hypothetical protein
VPVRRRRFNRLCVRTGAATALVAIAALAGGASAANAGVLLASAPSCPDQALSKPFAPWLDFADYTDLPGGDFEGDGAGWSTSGGAAIAPGNETFYVGGAGDSKSLRLPAGSTATSPAICVGIEHHTIRFFAKRGAGLLSSLSTLRVDAIVEFAAGGVLSLPVGFVAGFSSWQPTQPIAIVANLLALPPGEHTSVAFRFTSQIGDWSIDDVKVDPYGRR